MRPGHAMKRRLCWFAFALCVAAPAVAWEHWGGDRGGTRFSTNGQITLGNVGKLVRA
jgi:quinoprotein glucose dehydrogenase